MSDFRETPNTQNNRCWTSFLVAPTFVQRSTPTGHGLAVSDFGQTPKTLHSRSWTACLPVLLIIGAAALSVGCMPHGSAALAIAPARSIAIEVPPLQHAAAETASGTAHSAIATDAALAGDTETVQWSIAAYER